MSNEIAVSNSRLQEIIPTNKIQALKDQICKGASDIELQIFIDQCNRTRLDPFQKQCWAVKRWDDSIGREVLAFQTGVDGFRVIANRSDKYSGQVGPYWCGEDGEWFDVWLKNTPPVAAKVGVLRSDFKETMWAVAKFSSYAAKKKDGSLTRFWAKMPDLMIAKVAECLALRKAFPNDLSGIYSSEEMEQAEVKDVTESKASKQNSDEKPKTPKVEQTVDLPSLDASEPMPETGKQETEKPVEVPASNRIPNKARGIYVMKSGKYNGMVIGKMKEIELRKYVQQCLLHAHESGTSLPLPVIENIEAIKEYLGI